MQVLTYSQYCRNNQTRKSMTFMGGKFIHKGKEYSLSEVEQMFPIKRPLVDANDRKALKGENKNKKENTRLIILIRFCSLLFI